MRVKIFGAGIGGLTVAHMLSEHAQVDIYEMKDSAGGLARSEGSGCNTHEISWRVYFHFYEHLFSLLRQIPSANKPGKYVSDHLVPFRNLIMPPFKGTSLLTPRRLWQGAQMLTSSDARLDGNDKPWREMFDGGDMANIPQWLGMDRFQGSYTSVVRVGIEQNLIAGHNQDNYVLDGPTNDVFIRPWVEFLRRRGVCFHFRSPLARLHYDPELPTTIRRAELADGQLLDADVFVLALPVEALARIASALAPQAALLAEKAYQVQLAFQMYLERPLSFGYTPGPKTSNYRAQSVLLQRSPWSLIVEAKNISWTDDYTCDWAQWSAVICQATVPGVVFGKPFYACTEREAQIEIVEQMLGDPDFVTLLRRENPGFDGDLRVKRWQTMSETYKFAPLRTSEPKFSNNAGTLALRPHTRLGANVFLATAYVRETIDIFSMEAAAIAGKHVAAQIMNWPEPLLPRRPLPLLRPLREADGWLYKRGGPSIMTLLLALLLGTLLTMLSGLYLQYASRRRKADKNKDRF